MVTSYGQFFDFCRDSGNLYATIPVCNLFNEALTRKGTGFDDGCNLEGIPLSDGRHLANLGSILLCGIAIVVTALLLWRSETKKAAVGRREMQIFLLGFILIEICEIFTVGGFPLNSVARRAFTAVHIAAVTATTWTLLLNGIVGYQLLDDGTPISIGLMVLSSAALFIGTGYIALDHGFGWTEFFTPDEPAKSYSLYTLYFLVPLVFLFAYFCLESFLVLRILGEKKPMLYLAGAAVLFAVGQIFQYVVSVHLCSATGNKINGGLFETLFTLLAVIMVWIFWSSITEDDWPMPVGVNGGDTYT